MEAVPLGQAYLTVKMDVAWQQEKAKKKMNLYTQMQAETQTRSGRLTSKCERGKDGSWGRGGVWQTGQHAPCWSSLKKVGVVAQLSEASIQIFSRTVPLFFKVDSSKLKANCEPNTCMCIIYVYM